MTSNLKKFPFLILIVILCACRSRSIHYGDDTRQASVKLRDGEFRTRVNGVEHWFRVAGAKNETTPLVMIHGGPGGNAFQFEQTIGKKLSERITVVYYDQRGCGRSERPKDGNYSIAALINDLDELRKVLNVPQIGLLGSSFGGEIALEYALKYQGQTLFVILEGPSNGDYFAIMEVQKSNFRRISSKEFQEKIDEIWKVAEPLSTRFFKMWSLIDRVTIDSFIFRRRGNAALLREIWSESKMNSNQEMAEAIFSHQPNSPLLVERVKNLKTPTLFLIGAHDNNTGLPLSKPLHQAIAGSKLVTFNQSGHFPSFEEQSLFAENVFEFINFSKALNL